MAEIEVMAEQQFKNHAKYYPAHHFAFYPILIAGLVYCIRAISHYPDHSREWIVLSVLFFLVGWLSFMVRQHYGLGNQDRIIRLEMRFRYYLLTKQDFQKLESSLSFGQIAALRFASDEELPALLEKTLQENLRPNDIKKLIRNWNPDHMRV